MAIDTSRWNFGPDSPFLVGPVVGRVTGTTARLVVEASRDLTATISVLGDQASGSAVAGTAAGTGADDVQVQMAVLTQQVNLEAKRPKGIELKGLPPGKRVQVAVKLGDETRLCAFNTPAPNKRNWNVGLVSCNKISVIAEVGVWEQLSKEAPSIDAVLHMGDQVYGDEDFGRGNLQGEEAEKVDAKKESQEGCWGKARALVMPETDASKWPALRPQIKEIYSQVYRATWSYPPCAAALAATSNLMILDDHEITDDAGDVPEHVDPNTWQTFVIKCAYEVYIAYQAQLNGPVEDVDDWQRKTYFHMELFPGVGLFMMDVRLERSLLRQQQEGADWTTKQYLGPRQWAEMRRVLAEDYKDCKTFIFVSPTPPLFVSKVAASAIEYKSDDVCGSWGYKLYKDEQRVFLELVTEWQNARPDRAAVMCGGDIHIGNFADVQLASGGPIINQITASAVANLPETSASILNVVGSPLLALADTHVTMRVKHEKWIFEPNYGVMTIAPATHDGPDPDRPHITAKLVSRAKTQEHEFQYSIAGGVVGEMCHGCRCTVS